MGSVPLHVLYPPAKQDRPSYHEHIQPRQLPFIQVLYDVHKLHIIMKSGQLPADNKTTPAPNAEKNKNQRRALLTPRNFQVYVCT